MYTCRGDPFTNNPYPISPFVFVFWGLSPRLRHTWRRATAHSLSYL